MGGCVLTSTYIGIVYTSYYIYINATYNKSCHGCDSHNSMATELREYMRVADTFSLL